MDKDTLSNHVDYVQARIEEMDKLIINLEPSTKGYKEIMDAYNKWIDRYNVLTDQLTHLDDVDIEVKRLELERERLRIMKEIDKERIEIDRQRVQLDREKFTYETQAHKKEEQVDIIFRSLDIGSKVLVAGWGLAGTIALGKLAYINNADLKLRDGTIFASAKEVLKLAMMKI